MKIPTLKKMIKRDEVATAAPAVKKVAAKKAPAKKAAAKKAVSKAAPKAAKKVAEKKVAAEKVPMARLVVASDSESFWVTSGQILNSLVSLETAFATMPATVYSYHTSKTGSDFADWVEAVLMAPQCASSLRKAKTAKAAKLVVTTYLKAHKL